MPANYLVLDQYRQGSEYNDFVGKFYHFPKKHLPFFKSNTEFVYYEPKKQGKGVYFGYGKILKEPFEDKREKGHYFVEITDYKPFSIEVPFEYDNEARETAPYYNPQNAVRNVRQKILEEICLDGGILLNFQADAHLIKVLGEQLIATERVGILELIKNAYDAGASYCKISIENIPEIPNVEAETENEYQSLQGPVIVIEDNGKGMNRDIIENGWLRPASTIKTNVKEELKKQKEDALKKGNIGVFNSWVKAYKAANKGRLPLGEKGVGRFATNRLGKYLILKTKTKENNYEYLLRIDWDEFEKTEIQSNLDEIGIALTRQKPSRDYGQEDSGTQLIIYGGREGFEITKQNIQEIFDSIQSLNSPFKNPYTKKRNIEKTIFEVIFECPQLNSQLKNETIYDIAPPVFIFDALVNDNGVMDYELKFDPPIHSNIPYSAQLLKGIYDLRGSNNDYFRLAENKYREPECGQFLIHIDVWYRISPWIATVNVKKASDWLDNYGGIALYRDYVNLFPADWGANYDWLKLSKRHIQKGSNLSYYNIYGYVEVFQDSNIDIIDKTDRQGLLENRAFQELTIFIRTIVLNFIEKEFVGRRTDYTDLRKSILAESSEKIESIGTKSSNLVDRILNKYDIVTDPLKILIDFGAKNQREENLIDLKRSLENLEKSIKQIQQVEEKLVENASFGLSAAVAIHELAKITGNFYNGITQLLKADRLDKQKLNDLKDSASSLKSELKNLSPLRSIKNEPAKIVKISRAIEFAAEFYKNTFEKFNISFEFNKNNDFTVLERFGTISQIFTNLIDNSCYWLDTDKINTDKRIVFELNKERRTIIVADNGSGLDETIIPYLYQAGASMKTPPSGLGLYICQYYMNRMKGQIGLTNEKDRIENIKGAQFTLDFSRVPES